MIAKTVPLSTKGAPLLALAERTNSLIYSYPIFLDFLARATNSEPRIVVVEQAGEMVGALPFLTLEHPGIGKVANSLPWWGSHGSCMVDPARADANEIRRHLLAEYKSVTSGPEFLSATVILSHAEEAWRDAYVKALGVSPSDRRVGQISDLPTHAGSDGTTLLNRFSQKTRNLVRKSLKQGFVEQVTDDDAAWDFLQRIHTENILVLGGQPKPRAHFDVLRDALPASMRRLSLAMDGDNPVAALLLLYGGSTVEYVTPAVDVTARSRQPLSFLIWSAMLDAISRGFSRWNWGGTWLDQKSLHHFKAGFDAVDHPYSYFTISSTAGLAKMRAVRNELGILFPYFYVYPYTGLDSPGAA